MREENKNRKKHMIFRAIIMIVSLLEELTAKKKLTITICDYIFARTITITI